MRGKVKYAKFPAGLYYCQIEDVKAGISSKQEDIIIVTYKIQEGERADQVFKERLNSVGQSFLKGIGEPHEFNADWDTERWRNKFVWVHVKYSEDEAQWPRYNHYQTDPREKAVPRKVSKPAKVSDEDEINF